MMTLSDTQPVQDCQSAPAHWFDSLSTNADFVEGLPISSVPSGHWNAPPEDPAIAAAFAQGEAAAREAAEAQAALKDRATRELRLRFGELDSAALEVMETALADTVLALCDQVLGDHATDPEALTERCRDAAAQMGEAAARCALHLHPDDIALLAAETAEQWRIVPDDMLERGSVLFEGPDGAISDGPAEWRYAIASAIGAPTASQARAPE